MYGVKLDLLTDTRCAVVLVSIASRCLGLSHFNSVHEARDLSLNFLLTFYELFCVIMVMVLLILVSMFDLLMLAYLL